MFLLTSSVLTVAYRGRFHQSCTGCITGIRDPDNLACVCDGSFGYLAAIDIRDFMEVQDDGHVRCFGHISAPA